MVERRRDVDLDRGLGCHDSVSVSLSRCETQEKRFGMRKFEGLENVISGTVKREGDVVRR